MEMEPETFPLDDAAIEMVAEIRAQILAGQTSLNAVLSYFARQHKLNGQLALADNGRELIIKPMPQMRSAADQIQSRPERIEP